MIAKELKGKELFDDFAKRYNLTPEAKKELWDAIQEDYEDDDVNNLTDYDIIEIADACDIEFNL